MKIVLHKIDLTNKSEKELKTIVVDSVFVIKITIMVGIIGTYFIPAEAAAIVGVGSNLLWLWKV